MARKPPGAVPKWDRALVQELINSVQEEEPDQVLWVCLAYETKTGMRMEKVTLKELIRKGQVDGSRMRLRATPIYPMDLALMREILLEDPWLLAYRVRAYEEYRSRARHRAPCHTTVSSWMAKHALKIAKESPHWDDEILALIGRRRYREPYL